jgi:hypothetical protein
LNEVSLSNDLTTITTEIKSYQSIGGQAIFEIGRRLKWVKENNLAHGEFGSWLESMKINQSTANKFMKIVSELGNSYPGTNLGWKPLYLIATMPPEERDKPQQLSSGEIKRPDEMTVRELQEVKRKLKEKEQAIQDKDAQISKQAEMIDSLNEREPKFVEKTVTVEKIPDDYEAIKQKAQQADSIKEQLEKAQQQADYFKKESESAKRLVKIQDDEADQKRLERLKRKADINIYTLSYNIKTFINSNMLLDDDIQQLSGISDEAKSNINSRLDELQKFIDLVRQSTTGRKIIEGSFK